MANTATFTVQTQGRTLPPARDHRLLRERTGTGISLSPGPKSPRCDHPFPVVAGPRVTPGRAGPGRGHTPISRRCKCPPGKASLRNPLRETHACAHTRTSPQLSRTREGRRREPVASVTGWGFPRMSIDLFRSIYVLRLSGHQALLKPPQRTPGDRAWAAAAGRPPGWQRLWPRNETTSRRAGWGAAASLTLQY